MKYKLLAIGGPNNFEWLPWDGLSHAYKVALPPDYSKLSFMISEDGELPESTLNNTGLYTVDKLGSYNTQEVRHVYRYQDISIREAERLLLEHLMDMFIGVGDIEERHHAHSK